MTSPVHDTRYVWGVSYGVAALGWLVLSAPWLFGDVTIPYDAKAQFHPQIQFLANSLHSGQSPFWNPHIFAGSPQIADPQSLIFSPASVIGAVAGHVGLKALDVYVLVMVGLAVLAAMLFFQDRGWHPLGGLVAGFGVGFGASAAWRIQHVGQIQSYALLVLALWLLARALARRSLAYGAAAGIAIGLMIAQPDQVAYLGGLMLAGYALADTARRGLSWKTVLAALPVLVAIGLVAVLVAIVPVTLTYLFAAASSRAEIAFSEVIRGSLHPASLLTAVIGDLFGAHDPGVHYWGPYSSAWNPDELTLSQNMSQIYVGALAILLILTAGLWRGHVWDREVRFFTVSLIIVVLYALGGFTPVFWLFYEFFPGVSLFRRPADATFLIGICLAFVGGYLVNKLATGSIRRAGRSRMAWEAGCIVLVVLTGIAVAFGESQLEKAVQPMLIAVAMLVSAASVAYVVSSYARHLPLASAGVVGVFLVVDLATNNGPNESTALPAANYEMLRPDTSDQTLRFLKAKLGTEQAVDRRDRVELVGIGFSWPNLGMSHGFDHILGYNPLRLELATTVIGAGDTIAGWDQRRFTPLLPSYDSVLARLLGLRYIVTPVPIARIDRGLEPGKLRLIHRTKRAFVYENPSALARVMFVPQWRQADFSTLVKSGNWPEFDPRGTVLLAKPPVPGRATAATSPQNAGNSESRVSILRYRNTEVEIAVEAATPGFVVLNDIWHPWWFATVDGVSTPILKANVMFRAVSVPAGRHRVRFTFRPFQGALQEIFGSVP